MRRLGWATASFAVLMMSTPTHLFAGQVRVDIGGSGNVFTPSSVTCNLGDLVVWVWVGGTHSLTSGAAGCTTDGFFNIGLSSPDPAGCTAFTWKTHHATSAFRYFCSGHCPSMTGTLVIQQFGAPVADFRITEIRHNAENGLDLVEITNMGPATGDLGRYRFVASHDSATVPIDHLVVPGTSTVAGGGRVTVHVHASGVQSASDLYLPTLEDLPATGSLALYAPNTFVTTLEDISQIIDYLEWGAPGQANESTAQSARLWTAGEALGPLPPGRSFEYCGTRSQHGAMHWSDVTTPNFGSNGACATPVQTHTWGRVKTLYR